MTKRELREKYKALRRQLSNREQHECSEKIAANLLKTVDLTGKKVSCFVPIARFQEVNTWLILDTVKADFYLPLIGLDDELIHLQYEGKQTLKENAWGILEPQSGKALDPGQLDVVLVPLLTLNETGFRVGYGKGYYDQFLKKCNVNCQFIGLYQFAQFEEIDDLHPADVPLHACATPFGFHRF